MATAGLYETSGDWLYDVGLPGKSGIGGGIVTVSPGKGGLGTFAPRLDEAGNSVKGQLAARDLSRALGLDLFVLGAARGEEQPARRWRRSPSRSRWPFPPSRAADLADEQALAESVRARRPARRAGGGVRGRGEPYNPIDVDLLFRRADRRAPRAVEPHRPREDRPACRGSRQPLRVPPRLPR